MAVNPKLIAAAAQTLTSERVRNFILRVVLFALGLVMLLCSCSIFSVASGVLGLLSSHNVKKQWTRVSDSLSDVMSGAEVTINDEIKSMVYGFMPDFSVNLSKAVLGKGTGHKLTIYDSRELEIAEEEMIRYAEQLRGINNENELTEFMSDFYGFYFSFSDISESVFKTDTGITKMADYRDGIKDFLYTRAMDKMPSYDYSRETGIDDEGLPYTKQTLIVKTSGKTQTVEYIRSGGEIYLPRFLAMYNAYQTRETIAQFDENSEQAQSAAEEIGQIIGNIPESADEADSYFDDVWSGSVDGKSAIKLSSQQTRNIKSLLDKAVSNGDTGISAEQSGNTITVTLKAPSEEMWTEIFDLDERFNDYISETQTAIEALLRQAKIPQTQWSLSLGYTEQAELFVYFAGIFDTPVNANELAVGTAVFTEYGEASGIHNEAPPDKGTTITLSKDKTPIRVKIRNNSKCVSNAVIYSVGGGDDGESVTIAFIIDVDNFESSYGFPFPTINGEAPSDAITLFVEFSCLENLNVTEEDVGTSILRYLNDLIIGYSCVGDDSRDSHMGIKVFYSDEAITSIPDDSDTEEPGVPLNPRLWFGGFSSNASML